MLPKKNKEKRRSLKLASYCLFLWRWGGGFHACYILKELSTFLKYQTTQGAFTLR